MMTGGHNLGRVGIVTHRERHPGSFEIIHIKDSQGHTFATRYKLSLLNNCQLWLISVLHHTKGIRNCFRNWQDLFRCRHIRSLIDAQ